MSEVSSRVERIASIRLIGLLVLAIVQSWSAAIATTANGESAVPASHAVPAAHAAPDPHAILAEAGRITTVNGVDEAHAVSVGGIRQWVTVRGKNRDNPLLLLIHGGPAAPDLPNRYLFEGPWTDYFTVVQWDQRGSGKTFLLNDPAQVASTLSADRIVQDAVELVSLLRSTYHKQKIFVLGHSWGSLIGLMLAQRQPQWLYAYIGAGQIIDTRAAERLGYQFDLQAARADHNEMALRELNAIAPYPETDGRVLLEKLNVQRKWSIHYGGLTHGRSNYAVWENTERISPDYSEEDFRAIDAGSAFSLPKLLPDLTAANFNAVTRLRCPIIIFAGRYDETTPSVLAQQWLDKLDAPSKRLVWFENSAHMMYYEELGRVLLALVQDALPLALHQD